jgi:hypothetical protein
MNPSEHERFQELAHQALAGEATPAGQEELQALLAAHPPLREEMERLKKEAALLREALPLLEDLRQPPRDLPPPPRQRLRREVAAVFQAREQRAGDELRALLRRLRETLGGPPAAGRQELTRLIAALRDWLETHASWPFAQGPRQVESHAFLVETSVALYSPSLGPAPPPDSRTRLVRELATLEADLGRVSWRGPVRREQVTSLLPLLEQEATPPPGGPAS